MSAQIFFEELPRFLQEAFRLAFVTNAKQFADLSDDELEKDVLRSVKFWIQMIANGTQPVEPVIASEASRVVAESMMRFRLTFELPLALRKLVNKIHLLACEEKTEFEEIRRSFLNRWLSRVENRLRKKFKAHTDLLTKELKIFVKGRHTKLNCFTCDGEFFADRNEPFHKCPSLHVFDPSDYYEHASLCIEKSIQVKLKESAPTARYTLPKQQQNSQEAQKFTFEREFSTSSNPTSASSTASGNNQQKLRFNENVSVSKFDKNSSAQQMVEDDFIKSWTPEGPSSGVSWDDFKSGGIIEKLKRQNANHVAFREHMKKKFGDKVVMDCIKEVNANIAQGQSSVSSLSSFATNEPVPKSQNSVSSPNETEKKEMPKQIEVSKDIKQKMSAEKKFRNLPNLILNAFQIIYITTSQQLANFTEHDFETNILSLVELYIEQLAKGSLYCEEQVKSAASRALGESIRIGHATFKLPLGLKHLICEVYKLSRKEREDEQELREQYLKHWKNTVDKNLRDTFKDQSYVFTKGVNKELKIFIRGGRIMLNCYTCTEDFVSDTAEPFDKCRSLTNFSSSNYYSHAKPCIKAFIADCVEIGINV